MHSTVERCDGADARVSFMAIFKDDVPMHRRGKWIAYCWRKLMRRG
jgi:hypothetical protein